MSLLAAIEKYLEDAEDNGHRHGCDAIGGPCDPCEHFPTDKPCNCELADLRKTMNAVKKHREDYKKHTLEPARNLLNELKKGKK